MNKQDKQLFFNDLLKLLSSFDQWEEERVLFDSIQQLLAKKNVDSIFGVFCISSDSGQVPARVLWPTQKDKRSEIAKLVLDFQTDDGRPDILSLGEYKGQRYFALWPVFNPEEEGGELLGFLATFFRKSLEHIHRFKELKRAKTLMYQDDVTGLFNQRKLMQDLDAFIYDPAYKGMSFSLLFIDIDHFKKVNDGNGHLIGTELLLRFAGLLKTGLRDGDICYRYGGDEFVVILPGIEGKQAYQVAQRLLAEIKSAEFNIVKGAAPMTISASIGVAGYPQDAKGRDEILQMADEMMYNAKSKGRGQVCHIEQFTGHSKEV